MDPVVFKPESDGGVLGGALPGLILLAIMVAGAGFLAYRSVRSGDGLPWGLVGVIILGVGLAAYVLRGWSQVQPIRVYSDRVEGGMEGKEWVIPYDQVELVHQDTRMTRTNVQGRSTYSSEKTLVVELRNGEVRTLAGGAAFDVDHIEAVIKEKLARRQAH